MKRHGSESSSATVLLSDHGGQVTPWAPVLSLTGSETSICHRIVREVTRGHLWKGGAQPRLTGSDVRSRMKRFLCQHKQMLAGKQMLLFLFRRMFQNPLRVRTSLRLVSPSHLLSCFAPFSSLFKLPPSSMVLAHRSKALPYRTSDPAWSPTSGAPGRVSLSGHQPFTPGRKTMLGTGRDQVYIPQPTSGDGGAEGKETGQAHLSSPRVLGIPAPSLTVCVPIRREKIQ